MIKMVAAACRKPGMTHAEYLQYLECVHGALVREDPGPLRRYVQNHVFDGAFGAASGHRHEQLPCRDSIVELWFDSLDRLQQSFAQPHVREKVGPDGVNFADESATLSMIAREVELPVVRPGAGSVKLIQFLRKTDGLSLERFFERWRAAHDQALQTDRALAERLRRCVHAQQIPEGNRFLAYFNATDVPIYEGVASFWFDRPEDVSVFRAYERALEACNAASGAGFYAPGASFFVCAREVTIWDS